MVKISHFLRTKYLENETFTKFKSSMFFLNKSDKITLSMNGNLCNSTCDIKKYSITVSKLFTRAKKGEKLSLFSVRTFYI